MDAILERLAVGRVITESSRLRQTHLRRLLGGEWRWPAEPPTEHAMAEIRWVAWLLILSDRMDRLLVWISDGLGRQPSIG